MFKLGSIFFLLGIVLLIIRKNTYPWPIRRASDILFLLAAIMGSSAISIAQEWRIFSRYSKKVLRGLALIFSGILLASTLHFFLGGVAIDSESILSLGRFVEVGIIFLLIGFFQYHDKSFYKKVALAQLSTLIYLGVIFLPNNLHIPMYRFELFENWPSNVSYYLIVSISLIVVWILHMLKPFKKTFFIYYVAGIGLFATLLWTQVRASWLAMTIILILILTLWSLKEYQKKFESFLLGGLIIAALVPLSFFVLPRNIKNNVLMRSFPQLIDQQTTSHPSAPTELIADIIEKKQLPNLYEASRPYLWREYGEKILRQPLGFGLKYPGVTYEGTPRGPHNTPLEILMTGGIITLTGFLYLWYLSFQNLISMIRTAEDRRWSLYLLTALTGLAIAALFDNMSTFRLMWVVLALAVYYRPINSPSPILSSGLNFDERDR